MTRHVLFFFNHACVSFSSLRFSFAAAKSNASSSEKVLSINSDAKGEAVPQIRLKSISPPAAASAPD
jgi:hypothetical protein